MSTGKWKVDELWDRPLSLKMEQTLLKIHTGEIKSPGEGRVIDLYRRGMTQYSMEQKRQIVTPRGLDYLKEHNLIKE